MTGSPTSSAAAQMRGRRAGSTKTIVAPDTCKACTKHDEADYNVNQRGIMVRGYQQRPVKEIERRQTQIYVESAETQLDES